jgi:ribosome-associated protein
VAKPKSVAKPKDAAKPKAAVEQKAVAKPRAVAKPKKPVARPKPVAEPASAAPEAAPLPMMTEPAAETAAPAAVASEVPPKPTRAKAKKPADAGAVTALSTVLEQLDDAKAEQIITIDLDDKSAIADTMVVASGRSNRHVGAIADQIVMKLKEAGFRDLRIEGMPQCDWVLVDAGDVVVHIFRPEVRSFYNLEKLWSAHAPNERVPM